MHTTRTAVSFLLVAVSLAAQGEKPSKPALDPMAKAWRDALALARTHKAPILAFVLPPADAKASEERAKATWVRERDLGMSRALREEAVPALSARDVLLRQLQLLRLPDSNERRAIAVKPSQGQVVFALSVPVLAAAADCRAEPGETVVLLGPDGKRVRGFKTDLLDAEAFLREVGGAILDPAALAARRASVAPDLVTAVAALPLPGGESARWIDDPKLAERLRKDLPGAAPAIVSWADGELQVHPALSTLEEGRYPFGTAVSLPDLMADMCTGCGMGFIPPGLSTVLQLLGP
jgi:hypothetical protein